jgi:hypothetical protein
VSKRRRDIHHITTTLRCSERRKVVDLPFVPNERENMWLRTDKSTSAKNNQHFPRNASDDQLCLGNVDSVLLPFIPNLTLRMPSDNTLIRQNPMRPPSSVVIELWWMYRFSLFPFYMVHLRKCLTHLIIMFSKITWSTKNRSDWLSNEFRCFLSMSCPFPINLKTQSRLDGD